MRRRFVAALAAATAVCAAVLVGAVSVSAHAELIDARPLPGSTVGEIDRLEFRFAGDIIEDDQTSITLELRSDPDALVELGPPEVVITSAYWFVEDSPQPWGELIVRGAADDAQVTVTGVAGIFELDLESGDDGAFIDISSLDPDAISYIRVAEENIDPAGIDVELLSSTGDLVALSDARPASSRLAADVIGELPEAGDYIVRFNTVAADEGLLQPNGYLFSHDPAAAPSPDFSSTGSGSTDDDGGSSTLLLIALGAAVLLAAVGVGVLARRRVAVTDATADSD